jgi:HPr kinase/phosphorylase
MPSYYVADFYQQHAGHLGLELVAGKDGLKRKIGVPEVHRPGLTLAGHMKSHAGKRILVFGRVEIEYLRDLSPELKVARLEALLQTATPAVVVARRYRPPVELVQLCDHYQVPLMRASMSTMNLLSRLTQLLNEEFAPTMTCHATLVEVFGVGVLIRGDSAVGKSEAALGLVERGHRLVSDDVVKVVKCEGAYLEGYGLGLTQHHMEIRGIGIINVAYLYGAVCVRDHKSIDIVVALEVWDDTHFYDRVGLEEHYSEILDIKVPYHVLPVKPGRDVVLLLETIALNHRLKAMGLHSAQEFRAKWMEQAGHSEKRILKHLSRR